MNLYQIIRVEESGKRTMVLSPNMPENQEFLLGPLNLSFHPYQLCVQTTGKSSFADCLIAGVFFQIFFVFVDEQNQQNAFSGLSPSKSYLLLAEFNRGLVEIVSHLDFLLSNLSIDREGKYTISLQITRQMDFHDLLLGMVALFEGIDSLLYARGLMRKNSTLIVKEELLHPSNLRTLTKLTADDNC